MKRLITFIAICSIAMSLAACDDEPEKETPAPTPTEEAAPTEALFPEPTATSAPTAEPTPTPVVAKSAYEKGIVSENGFESEWLNLRFTAQAGMHMLTQEELDAVMLQSIGQVYGDNAEAVLDITSVTTVTEMMAQYGNGANVSVLVEKLPLLYRGLTEEEYLDVLTGDNGNAKWKFTVEENAHPVEFCGERYTGIRGTRDYGTGVPIWQNVLVRKKDGYMISIIINYSEYTKDYEQMLWSSFGTYESEPVVLPERTLVPSTYVKGTLTEEGFKSEWLNMQFSATEKVNMLPREELDSLASWGASLIHGENSYGTKIAAEKVYFEMGARHKEDGVLLVQVESLQGGYEQMTEEEYLGVLLITSSSVGMVTYEYGEDFFDAEVAGENYIGVSAVATYENGDKVYQECLVRKKEDRMITLVFTYNENTRSNAQYLLSLLTPYAEPVPEEETITVGEYKGLVLTGVSRAEVDAEIASMLEYYAELVEVDRAAEAGDTVNIDYIGIKDGKAFEGGTEENCDLVLGSGTYIDGFEEGLLGAMPGEIRDLNLTFPEEYGNADLAGQEVVFTVTVNAVKEEVIPELTDEFVRSISEYTTVKEYSTAIRESLNEVAYIDQITEQIMASSEVKKYDEEAVEAEYQSNITYYMDYASYYGSYYGLDTETAIMYFFGVDSIEAFEDTIRQYSYDRIKNRMIIAEIAKREGIKLTDDVYDTKTAEYMEAYGYEDRESFVEDNGEEAIRNAILAELVMEFILNHAVLVEAE